MSRVEGGLSRVEGKISRVHLKMSSIYLLSFCLYFHIIILLVIFCLVPARFPTFFDLTEMPGC